MRALAPRCQQLWVYSAGKRTQRAHIVLIMSKNAVGGSAIECQNLEEVKCVVCELPRSIFCSDRRILVRIERLLHDLGIRLQRRVRKTAS